MCLTSLVVQLRDHPYTAPFYLVTSFLARPAAAQQQAWQAICSAAVSYLFNYLILTISARPIISLSTGRQTNLCELFRAW